MTRTLYVYWQQFTRRTGDDADRRDAPVLDLDVCFGAACFGNPVIAARLAEPAAGRPGPR